jgi:hypothetical protein
MVNKSNVWRRISAKFCVHHLTPCNHIRRTYRSSLGLLVQINLLLEQLQLQVGLLQLVLHTSNNTTIQLQTLTSNEDSNTMGRRKQGDHKPDHRSKIYQRREGLAYLCHRSPSLPSAPRHRCRCLCTITWPRGA